MDDQNDIDHSNIIQQQQQQQQQQPQTQQDTILVVGSTTNTTNDDTATTTTNIYNNHNNNNSIRKDNDSTTIDQRKRKRNYYYHHHQDIIDMEDVPTITNDSNNYVSLPFLPLRQLRLEAIFYPKFENEQQISTSATTTTTAVNNNNNNSKNNKNKSIREQMMDQCIQNHGYIEVSIKHSGSLLLWSGLQRYYSKNSTNNTFTYVGEILLRQHYYTIAQIQIKDSTKNNNDDNDNSNDDNNNINDRIQQLANELYDQCSQYVVQNRLTISFENVTAILGDHGSIPHKDYIIVTAIADRKRINSNIQDSIDNRNNNNNLFYTTMEVIQFAQQFHLPHNDYWVYTNPTSIEQLFHLYDTSRETGTTSTVIPALSKAAMYNNNNNTDIDIDSNNNENVISNNDNTVCNYYIQSMYPHATYQGEILEGIVIRYVPFVSFNSSRASIISGTDARTMLIQQIQDMAIHSRNLLQQLSSIRCTEVETTMTSIGDNNETLNRFSSVQIQETQESCLDTIFTINLRQLYHETKALYSKKGSEDLELRLREILNNPDPATKLLQSKHQNKSTTTTRLISDPDSLVSISKQVPKWIDALLEQPIVGNGQTDDTVRLDIETKRIAKLIHDVSNISKNVKYTIYKECTNDENMDNRDIHASSSSPLCRYLCIVHVLHDQTFHKYHKSKKEADLPLFRGFSFQMIGGSSYSSNQSDDSVSTSKMYKNESTEGEHDNDAGGETLMLKMKFLPYMVRTFCCRNGLKIIRQADGLLAFTNFTDNMMSKWGISASAKAVWRPFFAAWAQYAQPLLRIHSIPPQTIINGGIDSIPLSEHSYLHHLEHFQKLYLTGKFKSNESRSRLQGLVVVVAVDIAMSKIIADYISERLGGTRRITGLNDVTTATMETACSPGQGIVCNTVFNNEYNAIRKHLLKDFENFISILVMERHDITSSMLTNGERKAMLGYVKGWKTTRCARNVALPDNIEPVNDIDISSFQPSEELRSVISQLEIPVVADLRPGLLVFFPTIPGSGKSSIVANIDNDICDDGLNRNIYIDEGDRLKGKFWPHIKKIRRQNFAGVHIADKNAPNSAAWCIIGAVCASTYALAVPVIPDQYALKTTQVFGCRKKDGTIEYSTLHIYPFSLAFLAVCMTRVLSRPAGTHSGQLDQSLNRLCMIVVKFFALYRHISSETLKTAMTTALESTGAIVTPTPIEIPFFNARSHIDNEVKLPKEVEEILLEALQCQFGYEKDKIDTTVQKDGCETDEYLDDLEIRLRKKLAEYRDIILDMTVDLTYSRQEFAKSIVEKIKEVDLITSYDAPSFIKIASIDVDFAAILEILKSVHCDDKELQSAFERILQARSWDSINSNESEEYNHADELGFVTKSHVTLAHYQDMSQSEIRSKFTPYIDSSVEITTNALLWNDRIMALAVHVSDITSDGTILPLSKNEFVHITVWYDTGVRASESNSLPKLVDENKAHRVEFPERTLRGVISLWNLQQI